MDGNEASQRREVVILHPFTVQRVVYSGEQIYSIKPLGVVISVSRSRLFYPWSRVVQFTYDVDDVAARNVIQGY